jgi:N-acetylneuraminate synthase
MEFTEEQWCGLKKHADERGLKFLSSPFSVEAVELLTRVGVAAWKIASGEMSNSPMFERITATKLPVILSSGMSPLTEIDKAVQRVKACNLPLTVLQCTSLYPCPPEKIGINLIPVFRERYKCAVGLSDHSGTISPGLAAATMGIDMLEVHVTLSREMFGPDVPVSVTTAELRQLVEGIRFIQKMNDHPVDKDVFALEMKPLRDLFTKSIVARLNLSAGTVLRQEDLTVKKPGTGIPASQLQRVVGRTLKRSVKADQVLRESDLV